MGVILWELRAKVPPEAAAQDTIGLVSAAFVRGGRGDEISPRTTHVVTVVAAFPDAGSIPAASTNLTQCWTTSLRVAVSPVARTRAK